MSTATGSPAALVWSRLLALPQVDDATAMQALDMVMEEANVERAEAFALLCGAAADGLHELFVYETPAYWHITPTNVEYVIRKGGQQGWGLGAIGEIRGWELTGTSTIKARKTNWLPWCDAAGRAVAILRTLQGVG